MARGRLLHRQPQACGKNRMQRVGRSTQQAQAPIREAHCCVQACTMGSCPGFSFREQPSSAKVSLALLVLSSKTLVLTGRVLLCSMTL